MTGFLINVLLAVLWMAVNGQFGMGSFVAGFLIGFLVLAIAHPLFPADRYAARMRDWIVFFFWFLKELWVSSLKVAWDVITPGSAAKPAIIALPLEAKTDFEITLLASCITLTPGTLSLDVSPDRKTLFIHAMFADDVDAVRRETKDGMERRVLQLTR